MGIAMFTLGGLLAPLHCLMGWFTRQERRATRAANRQPGPAHCVRPARAVAPRPCEKVRLPLRVIRVVEGVDASASAGRMFMSGRMADVCAELDRLAALEAG